MEGIKRLYHGSKNGIKGEIKPSSREKCDFGCGFYLGDKSDQPKGLIANRKNGMFYEIDYDFADLKIKSFGDTYIEKLDWALFIAYNRKPELFEKYTILKQRFAKYNQNYDVIIGYIADEFNNTNVQT